MTLKVGLIVGREWSFPPAFIEEVNRRGQGVTAEYVKLGAPAMDQPCEYAVIIDRISHEVPFYRTYLKQAVLQGCAVVNNPFMWTADDKFFGAALATRLGIAHPKTVVLPNKEYIPGVVHDESLRNLQYPLDWQGIVDYVGLPCVLKDAHGGGWKDVYVCRSLEELIHHYDTSGLLTMVVQEFIEWDHFIRCICIGQEVVMPIKYDPRERRYHVEHEHMSPELGSRVVEDSLKLVRALGYDMNSMEWAVKGGVPYAIDFMNPAPDMDIYSLTPHYFEWAVRAMADMAIDLAKNPRGQAAALRWDALFTGSRLAAAPPPYMGSGNRGEGEESAPSGGGAVAPGGTGGGGNTGGTTIAEASTRGGGPTAAENQQIQEPGASDAAAGGGTASAGGTTEEGGVTRAWGGGGTGGSPSASIPEPPTHASPGVYVDELPGTHAGPPPVDSAPVEGNPATPDSGSRGPAATGDAARAGEDTSPGAASDSTLEQA
jgi:hypothetical protein